ncbi:MAG: 23S rRNA (guanosine(2251)-2'-O)-methyltransferase RlmB, partial [Bryobacteraceae bacterium]
PLARIGNVSKTLEMLKKKNFWIYGIDERGSEIYSDVRYAEPAVIVLGGEGKGLHENVRKHCDLLVRIPMAGAIASLNVSVAAGVILFDWRRKRISSGGES